MTKRKIEYWVIPPEQDAEFVACMEEVLETYSEAYDPQHPVLCMDEQPVQLLKETKVPIPAMKKHGQRVDYEYERNGTASIFMFAEPLSGFRQATAREHRTKTDWAIEVACELSCLTSQCLTGRRIGELPLLQAEIAIWADKTNAKQRGVDWQFKIDDARTKLKRLYPKIKNG
jgi:hypothetical protein